MQQDCAQHSAARQLPPINTILSLPQMEALILFYFQTNTKLLLFQLVSADLFEWDKDTGYSMCEHWLAMMQKFYVVDAFEVDTTYVW
jgi:hypothetical protein